MTWLFAEVWVWSIAAFVLGALLTWMLFVRPLRNRLNDTLDALHAESNRYPDDDDDPDSDYYSQSDYYRDTSDSLPFVDPPDWDSPDSPQYADPLPRHEPVGHLEADEEEPTFGDWERSRSRSATPDVGVSRQPTWADGQSSFGDVRPGSPVAAAPPPPAPQAPVPPPELTEQFTSVTPPVPSEPAPTASGSGSSWFQTEDTQSLTPEGPHGGSEGRTEMFQPFGETPPGQGTTPASEGNTEMFHPVEDTVAPSAASPDSGRNEAAATGQLRSLFEPLTEEATPSPEPDPTVAETTQHIPRIEAEPNPPHGTESPGTEATSPGPGHVETGEEGGAAASESADSTVTHHVPAADESTGEGGSSPLPRRKPGAGPRPGAQNLNRGTEESGDPAEQESYTIKGHFASRQYHTAESPQYDRVIAEVWFRTRAEAEQAGFEPWDGNRAS